MQQRVDEDEGPDPVPGRPAGRRQDLARQVDRQGDRPQLRAHVAGRRARRGRDPRPPPDLYRLDARQGHPGHEEGEVVEPAVPARRDRQARRRLARRSVVGAARGARSGAELDLQRPLSRGRLRPVGRDVRHHGQHAAHAAAADGPHGDHPHPRLHRGREGRDRQAPPDPQADRGAWPEGGRVDITDDALRDLIRYYTREAGVRNLEREIANLARKAVKEIVMKKTHEGDDHARKNLDKYAGVRKFRFGETEAEDMVGVVTGLAWTEVGGEILTIEAVLLPGKGRVTRTGKLGDVMQESVAGGRRLRPVARDRVRHQADAVREARHPRARAGGRHAEGRPVGRRRRWSPRSSRC